MRENERNMDAVKAAFRSYRHALSARAYAELVIPILGKRIVSALEELDQA